MTNPCKIGVKLDASLKEANKEEDYIKYSGEIVFKMSDEGEFFESKFPLNLYFHLVDKQERAVEQERKEVLFRRVDVVLFDGENSKVHIDKNLERLVKSLFLNSLTDTETPDKSILSIERNTDRKPYLVQFLDKYK
ncbi:hypothetical protein JXB27_03025 [Candidatus Woesearchaeota archaeon]|nr:hypothetical protein [Candidatus Woesearchaeota archaeon]